MSRSRYFGCRKLQTEYSPNWWKIATEELDVKNPHTTSKSMVIQLVGRKTFCRMFQFLAKYLGDQQKYGDGQPNLWLYW